MSDKLHQLGHPTPLPDNPETAQLETITNPHQNDFYVVRLAVSEFTCLCPITGQPDFAHILIDYIPCESLVESKSFKLYMASFRNHGTFHEDCTMRIAKRLIEVLAPHWLRIGGYWYPRGGIPLDIFWQNSAPPAETFIPPQDVPAYRGR